MNAIDPIGVILDRAMHRKRASRHIEEVGSGWADAINAWADLDAPYLILLARTDARIPLTWMCTEEGALRALIRTAFNHVRGQRVQWLLLLERDSVGETTFNEELLHDTEPQGAA